MGATIRPSIAGPVVLHDACVLVPISLTDTLLHCAAAGLYHMRWSAHILSEVQVALIEDLGLPKERAERRVRQMVRAFPEAAVEGYEDLITRVHPRDEGDRHVLAAAVRARARILVTVNERDFPAASVQPHGIEVQYPDAFLTNLYNLAPDTVATLIRRQAGALRRPPMRAGRVLATLEVHVPVFAQAVHAQLQDSGVLESPLIQEEAADRPVGA